ncbi:neuroligin-2-like [Mercenaria mercenaria]|uniref:neuroligin-2-like n=1 Tax=Mercenaria mercenaria TaxID=6596 RepID=UPI00234E955B|nr:neuroligin-2-like [Mercenaria mercenaria]
MYTNTLVFHFLNHQWIHGGGFFEGAGSRYDGSFIAAAGNVIVVTINYRLGVFGFLSTGDHNAPGNAGLWDQHMALQWVHDHISRFGGDKERVSIGGDSAGAMSAIQHGLDTQNNGLFQRIIAQSGSMSMPVQKLERDVLKDAKAMAKSLGCETDAMKELMLCLRDKPVNDYLSAVKRLGYTVNFGPAIDDDLIKINPKHIAKMSESQSLKVVDFFRPMDILSGFNAYEGVLFLPFVIPLDKIEDLKPTEANFWLDVFPDVVEAVRKEDGDCVDPVSSSAAEYPV